MRKRTWITWAAILSSGALFQTNACTQTASVVTATASAVTAGSVIYIVTRIIEN